MRLSRRAVRGSAEAALRVVRGLGERWRGDPWNLLIAGTLLAGSLVLPLAMDIGAADAFALPKVRVLQGLSGVILVLLAFKTLQARGGDPRLYGGVDLAAAGFVVANVIAFAFSIDRHQSLFGHGLQHQGLFTILMYVGSFYAARLVFGTCARTEPLLAFVTLGGALVALYAVAQWVGLDPIWDSRSDGRVFSTLGQPNALAAYLVLVIPIAVVTGLSFQQRSRTVLGAGAAVVATAAAAMTLSRGGLLGLLVGCVVLAIGIGWRYLKQSAAFRLIPPLVLLLGVLVSVTGLVGSTWDSLADTNLGRRSDHVSLWRVGIAITADHPFVGTGQETYPIVFDAYRDRVLDPATARYLSGFQPESPHNVYIATAAGAGIPALAAMVVLMTLSVRHIWRGARLANRSCRLRLIGIAAAICGYLVTGLFMTQETTGSWTFWVLLGAGVETARRTELDPSAEDHVE